ncbi:aminoglycoside phosphotransferase family protein [Yoonia maritima]|uniref:aminoglycoside phosphotransferase family protein n=1 Tax=Yoonia maritima TaxID=1435347 RepID=UPI000D0F870B|nr:aminoglycoside phosphotransferase family protein [Yoonia maritima]
MSRLTITTEVVRVLIADQFPQWASLPIRPVANSGWDNFTFHLGDEMSIRLPSAACYEPQVAKEQKWLPRLAPHLPVPIPTPIAMGTPSATYPYYWSVMRWLPGASANQAPPENQSNIARDLARFLTALQSIPDQGGPQPGPQNFHRGGLLRTYDDDVRRCVNMLKGRFDTAHITDIWDTACASHWEAPPVWVHGDVAPSNFLIAKDRLAAVIDFGGCAVGDPACDLTIAWTYFTGNAQRIFRETVNMDTDTWARAKGWAIWKALLRTCDQGGDTEHLDRLLTEMSSTNRKL